MRTSDLYRIARDLHRNTSSLDGDWRQALSRFLAGKKPACLPNEQSEAVDFSSSIVVAQTTEVEAHLRTTSGIEELGPIIRDGVLPPYMYGPGLRLASERITDPLLQRTGCMPVCPEAGAQFIIKLALALDLNVVKQLKANGLREDADWKSQAPIGGGAAGAQDYKRLLDLVLKHRGLTADPRLQEVVERLNRLPSALNLAEAIAIWMQSRADDVPYEVLALLRESLGQGVSNERLAGTCRALRNGWRISAARDPIEAEDRVAAYLSAYLAGIRETHVSGSVPWQNHGHRANSWIIQGAGDLSFNAWNVGIFRLGPAGERRIAAVIPPGEPYNERTYRCLVGWHTGIQQADIDSVSAHVKEHGCGALLGPSVALLEVKFAPPRVYLATKQGGGGMEITDLVEFAVFGKSVLWDGQIVTKESVVEQFRDVRHVLALPFVGPPKAPDKRHAFGQEITADFYLLERALVRDDNLLRLACIAPISVDLADLGVELDLCDKMLMDGGYVQRPRASHVKRQGDYAWDGTAGKRLHVFLRPAAYPCSMVGLGNAATTDQAKECNTFYALACGHGFARGRFRIWEDCAQALKAVGARYALVLDEGEDVFQVHLQKGEVGAFVSAAQQWDHASLARHMPVPFTFKMTEPGGDTGSRHCEYKRTGMRASVAFGITLPATWKPSDPSNAQAG